MSDLHSSFSFSLLITLLSDLLRICMKRSATEMETSQKNIKHILVLFAMDQEAKARHQPKQSIRLVLMSICLFTQSPCFHHKLDSLSALTPPLPLPAPDHEAGAVPAALATPTGPHGALPGAA